jgi:DNA-binding response OmpR family regulator
MSSRETLALVAGLFFDVIVLDADPDGLALADVCRAVRRTPLNLHATIVVLAGTVPPDQGTRGLDICLITAEGADEIAREVARLAAAHTGRHEEGWRPPLFLRDLQIDPARRLVRVRGQSVTVTRQEFELLYLLASHPGLVLSRRRLLAKLWPPDTFVAPRSVDALVGRLRQKIERDPSNPTLLLTVWGDGYRIAEP